MSERHPTEPVVAPPRPGRRPCAPAEARRTVERVVAERRGTGGHPSWDADALSDALLVASELTTNAILHGGGITDFRVDVVGPGVELSVSDRSHDLPVVVPRTDPQGRRSVGGRGWPIVCRLARDVRVADLPSGGKCITVVVPLS
ncbi:MULTISPECIES: ATP-binding protein [Streptomyces]|uniref:ATP-binding protein n=2 Tax=Streptomyces rochei group TaxID=2867164 RepID=A0ABW7EE70_STRRO|nr:MULTISPECIES: ATP-binding protein [Streptomyces]MBX4175509.1 ATP-binding protein [Streptomyces geysiriensis]NEC72511.1 ATP-binding protein [Streptomyces rochei]NUV96867.1 ATP-binding protein [Streptomyces sp. KAI 90]PVD08520.1 ATP-binding protein [Streptomyces sp. CS207]RSS25078.1 ATP-binding protein [Streptomyces sp. WAC08452]